MPKSQAIPALERLERKAGIGECFNHYAVTGAKTLTLASGQDNVLPIIVKSHPEFARAAGNSAPVRKIDAADKPFGKFMRPVIGIPFPFRHARNCARNSPHPPLGQALNCQAPQHRIAGGNSRFIGFGNHPPATAVIHRSFLVKWDSL
jgi:hypothetical protein